MQKELPYKGGHEWLSYITRMPVSLLFKNLTTYPDKKQLLRKQMAVDGSVHDNTLRSHTCRSVKSSFSSSLVAVSLSWFYSVDLYLHIPEHSQFVIVLSCCFVPTYTWTQSVYHGSILLFCTYITPEHFFHCDSKLMQLLHRI